MKKALIIIPYFGRLPTWFQLYIDSTKSKLLDFILFTDDPTEYILTENFSVEYIKFHDFKSYFTEKLGQKVYLEHPYKLCDYKPLYGKVFSEYITGYDYWGYSDIDLIFGDIDNFISPYLKQKFDKLFRFGHFSLFRNDEVINNIYASSIVNKNFNFTKNTTIPCLFDEVSFNEILVKESKIYLEEQPFHNVNQNYKNFAVGNGLPSFPQLLVHDSGKLFIAELIDNRIARKEILYIHFMRRKNLPVNIGDCTKYIISRDGFIGYDDDIALLHLFNKYGSPVDKSSELLYRRELRDAIIYNKIKSIRREFKYYGVRAVYNVLYHYFFYKLWRF